MFKRFRYWLLSKLFTDDEKWLLSVAVDVRVQYLYKASVFEKTADYYEAHKDIVDYNEIRPIFKTDLYN